MSSFFAFVHGSEWFGVWQDLAWATQLARVLIAEGREVIGECLASVDILC